MLKGFTAAFVFSSPAEQSKGELVSIFMQHVAASVMLRLVLARRSLGSAPTGILSVSNGLDLSRKCIM